MFLDHPQIDTHTR